MTKEEQGKLRSNIEKIEAYIKAEIIPRLNGTRVSVDFGDIARFLLFLSAWRNFYGQAAFHACLTLLRSGRIGYRF